MPGLVSLKHLLIDNTFLCAWASPIHMDSPIVGIPPPCPLDALDPKNCLDHASVLITKYLEEGKRFFGFVVLINGAPRWRFTPDPDRILRWWARFAGLQPLSKNSLFDEAFSYKGEATLYVWKLGDIEEI